MPRVECPNCGAVVEVDAAGRTADAFCPTPNCDYPLFWVKGTVSEVEAPAPEVVRRRPGTGGRVVPSPERCPECREPNPPSNTFCQRCGADLHPPPPAPPPPPPQPRPPIERVPQTVPERRPWWLDWRLAAAIAIILVALAVLLVGLLAG